MSSAAQTIIHIRNVGPRVLLAAHDEYVVVAGSHTAETYLTEDIVDAPRTDAIETVQTTAVLTASVVLLPLFLYYWGDTAAVGLDVVVSYLRAAWDGVVGLLVSLPFDAVETVPSGCWVEAGTGEPMAGDLTTMVPGSTVVDCDTLPAWYLDAE